MKALRLAFVIAITFQVPGMLANAQTEDQQIAFGAIPQKTFGNAPFGLIATATSGLPVTFSSSNPLIASVTGSTVTIVGAGTVEITAAQEGDATYKPAPEVKQLFVVSKATQTITFQSLPARTYGDGGFPLTASSSSGLPVSFSSSNAGVALISGNFLLITGAGQCEISAQQPGSNNYEAAITVSRTFVVNKASQLISFDPLAAKTFGDLPFQISAFATSGLTVAYSSTNPSVVSVDGNQITILTAGVVSIIASQPGNANYLAADMVPQILIVNKASQSINFLPIGEKIFGDLPFGLVASASSSLPVTFTSQYDSIGTIQGSQFTIAGAGSVTITAYQPGNQNYYPQSTTQLLTINKAAQNITFAPLPAKRFGDPPFAISATASSGLAVTYRSARKTIARVDGNKVTIVAAGTASVIASQPGNSNYLPAPDVLRTFSIAGLENVYPLLGTTRRGGNGRGTIFSLNSDGSAHKTLKNFNANSNNSPQGGLITTSAGRLCGMILSGGIPANGVVFDILADGSDYRVIHNFQFTDGQRPFGNVLEASDGFLYGMTYDGGSNNTGTIFRVGQDGTEYSLLFEFPDAGVNGYNPLGGLIQAADGDLYGMTKEGGSVGYGVLFKIGTAGTGYTVLVEFDGPNKGSAPRGDLLLGPDQYLYGLTSGGGVNNAGVMFKVKSDGSDFTKLVDFDGASIGSGPGASLEAGSNGKFFGTTQAGGIHNQGTVFSVNPDGTSFLKLHDFDGINTGGLAVSSLVESASDGYLYGLTNQGGAFGLGTLYKIKTDGTAFMKLLDFNGLNGANPVFGPLLESTPGVFVGMTSQGGSSNTGVIFSITANGGYSLIKEFPQPEGTPESFGMATDGHGYFGVAASGGTYGNGGLYKTGDDGEGYTKIIDIEGHVVFVNKVITVSDGSIWGIGREGVIAFTSFLFRCNGDGTDFRRILNFDDVLGVGTGAFALLEAKDGSIYGTAMTGGSPGVIFKLEKDGSGFMKVADLPGGAGGSRPVGNFIQGKDGALFGLTEAGGQFGWGTVFRLDTNFSYERIFSLSSPVTGSYIKRIIELNDGSLCVLTAGGGAHNAGTAFTLSTDGDDYNKVIDFDPNTGTTPSSLIQTVDGYLIGTTEGDGQGNKGNIFRMLTDGSDFTTLFEFDGTNGSEPNGIVFRKQQQEIVFDAIPPKQLNDVPFALSASSTSGLPVIFSSVDENIAVISGNVVTLIGAGAVTITASVAGNQNFLSASATQSLVVEMITATGEANNTDVSVYPNPASNQITIAINSFSADHRTHFDVFDITGLRLRHLEHTGNTIALDTGGFAQGMYFITVVQGNKIARAKFIKD